MVKKYSTHSNIRFVMVHTSHPGNIGAVARVMKNMCLSSLYLVNPKEFPSQEADSRSSGALDVLNNAVVCHSLADAVADCHLVIGASARERTVQWELLTPKACGQSLVSASKKGPVAIVLGRERSGLTNEELDLCQYLVHIPSNPDYSSLNVAMAAQVLAYEVMLASQGLSDKNNQTDDLRAPLSSGQMQNFFEHLEQTLIDIEFMDNRESDKLMRRLQRFFYRAEPEEDEMNILRGILSAAQGRKSMRRVQ